MKSGVYIGMPEAEYFGANALGSTDLKRLVEDHLNWWAGSKYNPNGYEPAAKADARDSMALGKAVHMLALEGKAMFDQTYSVEPPWDAPHPKDVESMRRALAVKDIETERTIAPSAAKALCRDNGIHMKDDMLAVHKYEIEQGGKTPLAYVQYLKAKRIAAAIEIDPNLSAITSGGMSEVSVFWEQDGEKLRARFDKLLPRFLLEAKTITPNFRANTFTQACLWAVRDYRYDIQAELYSEARRIASSLPMFGGTRAQRTLLKKLLAVPEDPLGQAGWTFAWLFIQPPHDEKGKGRALKVLPIFPAVNPAYDAVSAVAKGDIATAIQAYKDNTATFGTSKAWQDIAAPWTPDQGDWSTIFKDRFS